MSTKNSPDSPSVSLSKQLSLEGGLFLGPPDHIIYENVHNGNELCLVFSKISIPSSFDDSDYRSGIVSGIPALGLGLLGRLLKWWLSPVYSQGCINAESKIKNLSLNGLLVEVGGGPARAYGATNLNINTWPNVDIVADAHALPYRDNSVDNIMSRAVLEHLSNPEVAVLEMYRCLKPGGHIFLAVPFLQPYHGYPHHFRGITDTGLNYLAESSGFETIDFGVALGPSHGLSNFVREYIRCYMPGGTFLSKLWRVSLGALLSKLDLFLNDHKASSICSFGVYYLGIKPSIDT